MTRSMLTLMLPGVLAVLVVLLEPAARDEQHMNAASAWNIDGDGTSVWCEGCCTAPLAWGCCIIANPCRHPYPEDPD
jgi:hypothetical protein